MTTGREIDVQGGRGVYDAFRHQFPRLHVETLRTLAAEWREYSAVYRVLMKPGHAADAELARHRIGALIAFEQDETAAEVGGSPTADELGALRWLAARCFEARDRLVTAFGLGLDTECHHEFHGIVLRRYSACGPIIDTYGGTGGLDAGATAPGISIPGV